MSRSLDLYDLALAGTRLVLDGSAEKAGPDARAHGELRSAVSAISARRSLLGLAPAWAKAGDELIRRGAIDTDGIEAAIATREQGESFAHLLLRTTDVAEGVIAEVLSSATTAPLIQLTTYPVHGEPFRSEEEAVAAPKHPVLIDELAPRRMPR